MCATTDVLNPCVEPVIAPQPLDPEDITKDHHFWIMMQMVPNKEGSIPLVYKNRPPC